VVDPNQAPMTTQRNKNVLLVGFNTDAAKAIQETGMNVPAVLHLAERGEKNPLPGVEIYRYYDAMRCELEVPYCVDFDPEIRHQLYNVAIHMFRRHYLRLAFVRSRALRSWTDLDNFFHIAANFYFNLLKRGNVTDVVFQNFPHEGSCIILYHLARLLGIRTLVAAQAAFPARIWIVREIEDFGEFSAVAGEGTPLEAPLTPTVPFYMKRAAPYQQLLSAGSKVFREALKLSLKYLTLQFMFNRDAVDRNMNRLIQASDRFGTGHPSVQDEEDVDLSTPYVYFGLHLQPEMTTDTWGFEYGDQILALEELSAALDGRAKIYVKENPKQTRYMRETSFFRRLRAIPNVHYIKPTVSSFELIERSVCVATISGTVGWEALLMGKGVVHFGVAWYASIPGAFRWTGPQSLTDALQFRGVRENLERAFAKLSLKTYSGVVDPYYGQIVENYDRLREIRRAVTSIASVMEKD